MLPPAMINHTSLPPTPPANRSAVKTLLLSLAMAFLTFGCASTLDHLAPENAGQNISVQWRFHLEALSEIPVDNRLEPVVIGDSMLVIGGDRLLELSVSTGKIKKVVDVPLVSSGLTHDDGVVYFNTREGEVAAIDLKSNEELWRTYIRSESVVPPTVANGVVVVRTIAGNVEGLSQETGETLWSWSTEEPPLTLRGTSKPLFYSAGGLVIILSDGCKMTGLDIREGNQLFSLVLDTPTGVTDLDKLIDGDGTPTIIGENLYAGCYNASLKSISLREGEVLWSIDSDVLLDVQSYKQNLISVDSKSTLRSYNASTGRANWENFSLKQRNLSQPAVWDEKVVLGDHQGYVHVFDVQTGKLLSRSRPMCAFGPIDDRGSRVCSQTRSIVGVGDGFVAISEDGWIAYLKIAESLESPDS